MNDPTTVAAKVTVVMVSFHTGPALFDALRAATHDPNVAEIILVDNGNPPEARRSVQSLADTLGTVRLVQGQGNVGFARACNYGATLAATDFLLFLNPDAVVEPGAIDALLQAARGAARPWLVGARLIDEAGRELRGSRRGALTPLSALAAFTPLGRFPGMPRFNRHDEPLPETPVALPTLSGACLLTDRASFDALGGFDEGYFLHIEDIDICRRVRRMGGTVRFAPDARVLHHTSTSDAPAWTVERHKLRGFLRYFWTDGSKAAALLLAPLLVGAIAGRQLWRSVRR